MDLVLGAAHIQQCYEMVVVVIRASANHWQGPLSIIALWYYSSGPLLSIVSCLLGGCGL